MKVLFVCSGNSEKGDINALIRAQAISLESLGISVIFYAIKGKGLFGYLGNVIPLIRFLRSMRPDVVHAHYSFSGIVSSLAGAHPLVISLMGSDINMGSMSRLVIKLFNRIYNWKIILKSSGMNSILKFKNPAIIPNGVNTEVFKPMDQIYCREYLNWDKSKKYILFGANKNRHEKNYSLALKAFNILKDEDFIMVDLADVPHNQIPFWMCASDLILITSLWEGSPNVIKEAMACGRPVVSTDVGDVKWLFGDVPGHFLTTFDSGDVADKISEAIFFSEKKIVTNGRQRIFDLNLTSRVVANQLIELYRKLILSV
jgi:glycosyltransferase involved in cell wall biosynthesis